ncbi:MAG: hypothetical protein WBB76_04835, partial [Gaiellaceae bacterium]
IGAVQTLGDETINTLKTNWDTAHKANAKAIDDFLTDTGKRLRDGKITVGEAWKETVDFLVEHGFTPEQAAQMAGPMLQASSDIGGAIADLVTAINNLTKALDALETNTKKKGRWAGLEELASKAHLSADAIDRLSRSAANLPTNLTFSGIAAGGAAAAATPGATGALGGTKQPAAVGPSGTPAPAPALLPDPTKKGGTPSGHHPTQLQHGGFVAGLDRGFDSVHALLRPKEVVLNAHQQSFFGGPEFFSRFFAHVGGGTVPRSITRSALPFGDTVHVTHAPTEIHLSPVFNLNGPGWTREEVQRLARDAAPAMRDELIRQFGLVGSQGIFGGTA